MGKSHVKRYSKIEDAEIVTVADVDEAEGKRVAETAGVGEVFTDFRELLKMDDIQAVGYDGSQEYWIASLQGRVDEVDSAGPGLAMLRIAEGVYLSQTFGREVTTVEIEEASVSTAITDL